MSVNTRKRNIDLDKHIGKRLALFRAAQNLSQSDLASVIGITYQQLQKYEAGANRIAASTLYEIASYLRLSVEDFYGGFYREGASKKYRTTQSTVEGIKIITAVNRIEHEVSRKKTVNHMLPIIEAFTVFYDVKQQEEKHNLSSDRN